MDSGRNTRKRICVWGIAIASIGFYLIVLASRTPKKERVPLIKVGLDDASMGKWNAVADDLIGQREAGTILKNESGTELIFPRPEALVRYLRDNPEVVEATCEKHDTKVQVWISVLSEIARTQLIQKVEAEFDLRLEEKRKQDEKRNKRNTKDGRMYDPENPPGMPRIPKNANEQTKKFIRKMRDSLRKQKENRATGMPRPKLTADAKANLKYFTQHEQQIKDRWNKLSRMKR